MLNEMIQNNGVEKEKFNSMEEQKNDMTSLSNISERIQSVFEGNSILREINNKSKILEKKVPAGISDVDLKLLESNC